MQEIQPSPLALLAATCSKIGTSEEVVPQQLRVLNAAVLHQLEQQNREESPNQVVLHHVTTVASSESSSHGQQQQTAGVKTFVSSAAAVTPAVVSGQFLQVLSHGL